MLSLRNEETLAGLWRWRYALRNLVAADFCVRYRNMSLGVLWSLLNPLVLLGMFAFVFTYAVRGAAQPFFPVFLLLGIVLYNFFSLSLAAATPTLLFNARIVKKVPFPRLLLPVSIVLSQGAHFLIQTALLGLFMAAWRVPLTRHWLWVPAILAVELAFVIGIACAASALSVCFRDTRYIVESGLVVLFWLTPVFYPLDAVRLAAPPWLFRLYLFNPLAGVIDSARAVLLRAAPPDPLAFGTAAVMAAAVFVAGLGLFRRLAPTCADHL